jgi:hypothetical protein
MGRDLGYEVIENYDLGGGPIHVCWIFKPGGSESLPDMRLGFICMPEFTLESSLNEAIARAMINLIDKLVIVVPTEEMVAAISRSIENVTNPYRSILQLRKYTTVLTPSTLVSKKEIEGAREKDGEVRLFSESLLGLVLDAIRILSSDGFSIYKCNSIFSNEFIALVRD